jgi:hypothetical protein
MPFTTLKLSSGGAVRVRGLVVGDLVSAGIPLRDMQSGEFGNNTDNVWKLQRAMVLACRSIKFDDGRKIKIVDKAIDELNENEESPETLGMRDVNAIFEAASQQSTVEDAKAIPFPKVEATAGTG